MKSTRDVRPPCWASANQLGKVLGNLNVSWMLVSVPRRVALCFFVAAGLCVSVFTVRCGPEVASLGSLWAQCANGDSM